MRMEFVLESARLRLRRFTEADPPFILELVNDPKFLRHIGDRNVRSTEDARRYLREGPIASHVRHGYGLYRVELKASSETIGMCGVLKRAELPDPDIGYALLARFRGRGYATEAAGRVVAYVNEELGLARLLALVARENDSSARVLEKLGFRFDRIVSITRGEPPRNLFSWQAA